MAGHTSFPPVRATIFDMDGLLIDSEDKYTDVTNTILRENGRPDLPWHIKAQLQGRPGPQASKIFHEWAQLPIDFEHYIQRLTELQHEMFQHCKPLPGAERLLNRLHGSHTMVTHLVSPGSPPKIRMALATSSHSKTYEIKTAGMKSMFSLFPERQVVLGDDPRIPHGRGKPLPDIYLLALEMINQQLDVDGEQRIRPEECVVFEDSVPGVEAGRRAGMRVVWCPHPGLLNHYRGREEEVLAGLTGTHDAAGPEPAASTPLPGSPGQVGQIDDGWAELLETLEDFDYVKYGIDISDTRYRTESGQSATDGTTDKELEEMTAMADGKLHAPQEPKETEPSR